MKRFFFLICLIASTLTSFASSETFQLPDSLKSQEKVWVTETTGDYEIFPGVFPFYNYYYYYGTALINGHDCQLYSVDYGNFDQGKESFTRSLAEGAYYYEDNNLYIKQRNSQRPDDFSFLLYMDFNLAPGDSIISLNPYEPDNSISFLVKFIDFVEVNGVARKRIAFASGNDGNSSQIPLINKQMIGAWVEGVGKSSSFLGYELQETPSNGQNTAFYGYFENGKCVFTHEDFMQPYTGSRITTSFVKIFERPAPDVIDDSYPQIFALSGETMDIEDVEWIVTAPLKNGDTYKISVIPEGLNCIMPPIVEDVEFDLNPDRLIPIRLVCNFTKFKVIYQTEPLEAIWFPMIDDLSGIQTLRDKEVFTHSPLFDLMGREVTSPQPGSVYIRNGKKFILK